LQVTSREAPFESEQHPLSRRWAVVEDDGDVAWLYLSAPDSLKPVAACFLYNQPDAPVDQLVKGIHFRWSVDGNSVAVLFGELVMGFIAEAKRPGFSRLLKSEGSLGNPMDAALYERTFRAT
jgi:hypothetical protein